MTAPQALSVAFSFLIGSFPTAFIAGRLHGIDIRTVGSGNVGATNVFRTLGKKWGILTLFIDMLKGAVPVAVVARLFPDSNWLPVAAALAAVLGHTFSPFLKFKGGKGVATSGGAFLALLPVPTLIGLAVFGVVFAVTRIVAVGSLSAAVVLPLMAFIIVGVTPASFLAFVLAILIIVRHIPNIRRLMSGCEHGFKKS